ncbi:MAG TPA: hypothetical protein VHW68_06030 [Actinomycetota bacterium]|nr:hypothetical protein [Actinomycetota bacterium]
MPVIIAVVAAAVAGVVAGRMAVEPVGGVGPQPGPSTAHLANMWLVGPTGQNVLFCPHPEEVLGGGFICQPLDRVGALVPDVLPPEPMTVAPGCAGDYRLIFNFEDRSRAVYDVCEMPPVLVPLYEAAWKVMTNITQ